MDVLDSDISGLLSLALSQQGSGTLSNLRAVLGELLVEELQVCYDVPPAGAVSAHRDAVFDLFLPLPADAETATSSSGSSVLVIQRRYVLGSMCNGDLQQPDIVHHCSYGCCRSFADTEARFRHLVPWALVPHKTPRYARSRWTNHAASVDWSGVLASHHGLLSRLLVRWTGGPTATPAGPRVAVDAESAAFLMDAPMAAEGQSADEEPGPSADVDDGHDDADAWLLQGIDLDFMQEVARLITRVRFTFRF